MIIPRTVGCQDGLNEIVVVCSKMSIKEDANDADCIVFILMNEMDFSVSTSTVDRMLGRNVNVDFNRLEHHLDTILVCPLKLSELSPGLVFKFNSPVCLMPVAWVKGIHFRALITFKCDGNVWIFSRFGNVKVNRTLHFTCATD